jgi:purine nucleoside phosphorylase
MRVITGGTGHNEFDEVSIVEPINEPTSFNTPSSLIVRGPSGCREVRFLSWYGAGDECLPPEDSAIRTALSVSVMSALGAIPVEHAKSFAVQAR